MEEMIWRWVCIAWKSRAVCLSRKGWGKSLYMYMYCPGVLPLKYCKMSSVAAVALFLGRLKLKFKCFRFIMGKVLVKGLLVWSRWWAWPCAEHMNCLGRGSLDLNQTLTVPLDSVLWLFRSLFNKSLTCTFPKPLRWRICVEVKSF